MLTKKQLSVIHIAKKELGLDDDTYQSVLYQLDGVTSSKDLSPAGFHLVMSYFTKCGFRSTWTKRTFGDRGDMASPAQVDLVRDLWKKYSGDEGDVGWNAWIKKYFKVSALRFVDDRTIGKVITALKNMNERTNNKSLTDSH